MPTLSTTGITSDSNALAKLAKLEGLIPAQVGEELYALAGVVGKLLAVVEVGSYKGKSTCYLAAGARAGFGAHVWAVDPWDLSHNETGRFGFAEAATREAFHRQVAAAGLRGQVTPIQGFSTEVARHFRARIGLLYIDGDHSFKSVLDDFQAWRPYCVEGATVVFDDYDTPRNPGVRKAIETLGLEVEVRAGRLAVASV